MALRSPEASIGTGLAVCGLVYAVHANATPSMADMQALPAGTADVDDAERKATWMSAGIVCAISLIAKDPTVFVLGSAATIALAFLSRQATWTESKSSPMSTMSAGAAQSTAVSANDLAIGPQMTTSDYTSLANASFTG